MNDFFPAMYEAGGLFYFGAFSDDLYFNNLYFPIGMVLLLSSIAWMVIYYYFIDHPRFAKPWHWLIWILVICLANFGWAYYTTQTELEMIYNSQELDLPYLSEFLSFALVNTLYTFLFSFGISFIIKGMGSLFGLSVMTRKTPF